MAALRTVVIMNPAARSTKASGNVNRVRRLQPAAEILLTEHVGHARELAMQAVESGADIVVAAGGDGTVNEVLQGLCTVNARRPDPATHCALGTLPLGTMNVFAHELGLRSRTDLDTPWRVMHCDTVSQLDLWMANDQYFVQLAGVGVDAEIVKNTSWEDKKRYGPLSYVLAGLRVLSKDLPLISIDVPGRPKLHGTVALIGNGSHYGGPFKVFPGASNTDGLLDVVLFRERNLNVWQMLQMLRGMWKAPQYQSLEDIDYLQLAEFTVTCEAGTAVQLDGELSGATPVVFRKASFPPRVANPYPQASSPQLIAQSKKMSAPGAA